MSTMASDVKSVSVSSMTEDWFAFCDDSIVALGVCEDFDEADSKAPERTHWIFSRSDLRSVLMDAKSNLDSSGAEDWFAFCGDSVVNLGCCDNFNEADSKAPDNTHWLFSRLFLQSFVLEVSGHLATQ